MSLTLILGPMFSGKSSTLLSYERKFQLAKKNYICIKPALDKRYADDDHSYSKIATHDNKFSNGTSIMISSLSDINYEDLNKYNAFIIDEVQFIDGIDEFVSYWIFLKKDIICAGLSGDYKMKPFKNISNLLPLADSVQILKSYCSDCGKDAPFTERTIHDTHQVVIGTEDIYLPKCRYHHKIF